jgi:putative acetyltransferase
MKATIRQYQGRDLNNLLTVWENASKIAHPFLTKEFIEQERYNIPNVYIPNADTWVVLDNDKVVGFIALIGSEIGAIFVHPDYQGRGFGKTLMDKAYSLHSQLEVEVFKENTIGRRFYDRYGFKLLHEKLHEETGNMLLRLAFTA